MIQLIYDSCNAGEISSLSEFAFRKGDPGGYLSRNLGLDMTIDSHCIVLYCIDLLRLGFVVAEHSNRCECFGE